MGHLLIISEYTQYLNFSTVSLILWTLRLLDHAPQTSFCFLYPFESIKYSFFFFKFIYLFIFGCAGSSFLCEGFFLVAASGGHSSSRCVGLSLSWPLLLRSTGSRRTGSVVVAHGLGCSAACGIFPDQGSNPCPLHWQADSQPLCHQGSPYQIFLLLTLLMLALDICFFRNTSGLPWWRSGWESACQCRGHGFEPWSGKIPHAAEQPSP